MTWNKRGVSLIYEKLIIITLIVFVAVTLFLWIKNVGNDTLYWKNYYAKDVALITDLLHATNGIVNINYDVLNSPKKLEFLLQKDSIAVYDYNPNLERGKQIPTIFRFAKDKTTIITTGELSSCYFKIIQKQNTLSLEKDSFKTTICPLYPTTKKELKSVSIYVTYEDDEFTKMIGEAVKKRLETKDVTITISKEDADISIKISIHQDQKNMLKIFYPVNINIKKSEKLSCIMKNQLTLKLPGQYTSVKEESANRYSVRMQGLNTEKPGVEIEIGSQEEVEDANALKSKQSDIVNAIIKGVEDYFK
ncbi:MAG: N-acetylmuramoyl-L-alanine amidase [Nanoarchaeota archaeon]|nr:N-acetylmuramoyl-L-alanine amidase [Nanoarchaeota archaeon]MBU1029860.1 N-acetylmuramoyl-L-alanine amidase [Nanoarchaeota archaeon]